MVARLIVAAARLLVRGAEDQPELVGLGVVEGLADRLGLDQDRAQRLEGEDVVVDVHPAGPLEDDVELDRLAVAVEGRGLARRQAPEAGAERLGPELAAEVGVEDAHLVRGTPEGVGCWENGIRHRPTLPTPRVQDSGRRGEPAALLGEHHRRRQQAAEAAPDARRGGISFASWRYSRETWLERKTFAIAPSSSAGSETVVLASSSPATVIRSSAG